jgi:hypothetical protein
MGLPHEITTRQGRTEMGAFAAAWVKVQSSGMSLVARNHMLDKSLEEAKAIAGKKKSYCRSVAAVWTDVFNKRLDTCQIRD